MSRARGTMLARWALTGLLLVNVGCSASEFSGGGQSQKAEKAKPKSAEQDDKTTPPKEAGVDRQGDGAAPTGTQTSTATDIGANDESPSRPADGADTPEAKSIKATLDNLRWDLPCDDPSPGRVCDSKAKVDDTKVLAGDAKTLFSITLRFRGIVEPKPYKGGSSDGAYWQIGGEPSGDAWNIYKLEISNPPQTYYLNRADETGFIVFNIDYQKTVKAYGGASFHISADTRDGAEISNHQKLIVPGIEDTSYNGQFVHISVVKIEAGPAAP